MNLSTHYMYQQQTQFIMSSASRFNDVAMHLSANTRVLRPSDDPAAAMDVVTYRNALAQLDYYSGTRGYARAVLTKEGDTLQTVTNTLSAINAKIMAIQKPAGDLAPIIQELEGLRDDLLASANAQDTSGNYIFAGYKADVKPFQKAQGSDDIVYQGGGTAIGQQVDEGREMKIGHIGSDIFNIEGQDTVFKKLDALIGALKSDAGNEGGGAWPGEELKAIMDAARSAVRKTEDNVGNAQVVSGLNLQLLDNLDAAGVSQREGITDRLQQGLGQDTGSQIALVTELQLSQVAMDSSMMVFQMMQNMSLFNLMK
ncbi:flagellar biosynthesis; hook-filament junction protein [Candidatus Sodalis pierantonius str. SOPE]|uniref:Flagellar biosynthesis hook-filament junction protein n=1 Tax=Candidatus Sodalis pierantonii str. SOPE TaxID=2342 RepID=W0HLL3_9GAMM|nr:flagellar hook-associated protein FlgL [Candidatus Sodalis pierantonius]AHF73065.1 flagellar biosynthesis; hook-filament junction protein [Candidatus Sodalis pierantonius str. SOPE]